MGAAGNTDGEKKKKKKKKMEEMLIVSEPKLGELPSLPAAAGRTHV